MGAMLATGRVDRVSFNGNRGTVTLMFWRRRGGEGRSHAHQGDQNRELNCRPHPSQEFLGKSRGGPKPVAKSPWAVPSGNWNPASPARTTGKGTRSRLAHFTAPPRPSSTGRSTLHPTAPVEPPATAAFTSSRWPRRERRHRRCRLKS